MSAGFIRVRSWTGACAFRAALACAIAIQFVGQPLGLGAPARAQESADQDVSPNISVSERFAQTYGADGVKSGGFTLFPVFSVAGIYDDNIFGTTAAPTDDFIADIRGELTLRSNWSVHGIELFSRAQRLQFFDNESESTTDYIFGGNGFVDVASRSRARFSASHRRATEPRRATQTAIGGVEPVRFSTTAAAVDFDFRQIRFREEFGVSYTQDDYDDVGVPGGGVIDQDFRDRKVYSAYYRQSYRFRPTIAAFVEVSGELQEYDSPQISALTPFGAFQDSESYEASGGVAFDINKVARGEIGLGYQNRDYDDPAFTDVSGFNVDATLEYFLSDLTTVTIRADRSIRDTAVPGVAGFYSSGGDVTVEHELLRPVLLVATAEYRRDDFRGVDRQDELLRFTAGVSYAFRREAVFELRYVRLDVDSSGLAARGPFKENMVRLGFELRL